MRILFTGASSFSGFHFVSELATRGHQVICPLRGVIQSYTGVRRKRVDRLRGLAQLVEQTAFGEPAFLKLISETAPLDVLCHHAADVGNYKSPDFDPLRALENNTRNLTSVLFGLKQSGAKAVVLTGTLFEPDEGKGDQSLRAFSPYGLSKGLTWQTFRYYCETAALPLAKFVMPNPFGPWEERGFTPYLMNRWKAGNVAQVQTPDYVRDNCHVGLLARAYVDFADRAATQTSGWISLSPSGYVESQGEFIARVAREVKPRTSWRCDFELLKQIDFAEPMVRSNRDPVAPLFPQWREAQAWDELVKFYEH